MRVKCSSIVFSFSFFLIFFVFIKYFLFYFVFLMKVKHCENLYSFFFWIFSPPYFIVERPFLYYFFKFSLVRTLFSEATHWLELLKLHFFFFFRYSRDKNWIFFRFIDFFLPIRNTVYVVICMNHFFFSIILPEHIFCVSRNFNIEYTIIKIL